MTSGDQRISYRLPTYIAFSLIRKQRKHFLVQITLVNSKSDLHRSQGWVPLP